MFVQKKVDRGQVGDIHFINGKVQFQKIRLNVYIYCYDGLLLDTGSSSLKEICRPFFHEQSFDQVVISHIHEDHTGNAGYIQQNFNVPIYLSEKSMRLAHEGGKYPLYRHFFWGKREPFHPLPMPEKFSSRQYDWLAIETPGHAYDHCAFLNESTGQLFTGDLYVQTKSKVTLREEHTPSTIRSLQKVLQYDFDEVFCQHAGYLPNGREHLEAKLDYLQNLTYRVERLYQEGYSNEHITKTLFPKKYPIMTLSLGEWDALHIVQSIIAELKVKEVVHHK